MKISVIMPLLVPTPFLQAMTEFAIKTLRLHADQPFELVVVEANWRYFDPETLTRDDVPEGIHPDIYLNLPGKPTQVQELNAAVDAATGDLLVFTGNDLIAPPHWDTELKLPFEKYKDCGASALSAFEPGGTIGPDFPMDLIVEGMYSPFMAFKKGWRYDEAYERVYQDSDLIMRLYGAGLRSYRSCRAQVHHLLRMTNDRIGPVAHNAALARDEKIFYERWHRSPLMMYGVIRMGQWVFGREHHALTAPIALHHTPEAK